MWKIGIGIATVGLLFCVTTADQGHAQRRGAVARAGGAPHVSFARPAGGGGFARFGGGGFHRFGGGGFHHFGGGGFRRFGGAGIRRFGGARSFRFGGSRIAIPGFHRVSGFGRRPFFGRRFHGGGVRAARFTRPIFGRHAAAAATGALAARHGLLRANRTFHPFARAGFRRGHIGWFGPLFWPYAYGDFFYYALWPYEYEDDDPFWAYGYDDIYESVFWPYSYDGFVQGSGRRARARLNALTERVEQTCAEEAGEVLGWPVDQIREVVGPNEQQRAALDALGEAIVKASQAIRAGCPTSIAFTPTGRLEQMQKRLEPLIQAVNLVRPAVAKFYEQLGDEQKARFNALGAPGEEREGTGTTAPGRSNPQAACGADVTPWPNDAAIERALHPTDAQRVKLDELKAAATKAADLIKAACPRETPLTPPDRLAAVGKRLDAVLQGLQTVRAAVDDFYATLNDEQKARFNALGMQRSSSR